MSCIFSYVEQIIVYKFAEYAINIILNTKNIFAIICLDAFF
ncbi:hypothetical protein SAMN04488587_1226 [Methanococcoides vulcani]|uniref:Uncharacterized protein n=1 Tax=Methanococcoides vulcani TaxID=1353158 RepID=A0A1H9ZS64_9EURY|nr:hypothetical protein SAMN04488587_1226 [Methanococcoides vulcani]